MGWILVLPMIKYSGLNVKSTKNDNANDVLIEQAKLKSSREKLCLNPTKCELCDEYKLTIAGKKRGRPISKKGVG